MIVSLLAIGAVMAAACLFGYAMHGVIQSSKFVTDVPEEPDSHDCNTCVYDGTTKPNEEPCYTCLTQDVDMWEAKDGRL